MRIMLNDPKIVAAYSVMPEGEKEAVTVVVREKEVTSTQYEVIVVGGLLGNGQESAIFPNVHQAMDRAQDEADSAMLGGD